ncbi:hypothetical protein GJV44_p00022 (plasmid) [Candidatus Vallotia cooleyia]|nr:hypothetical protein GJV44_p00022 [Candidatus Vallotia cooleyia]
MSIQNTAINHHGGNKTDLVYCCTMLRQSPIYASNKHKTSGSLVDESSFIEAHEFFNYLIIAETSSYLSVTEYFLYQKFRFMLIIAVQTRLCTVMNFFVRLV